MPQEKKDVEKVIPLLFGKPVNDVRKERVICHWCGQAYNHNEKKPAEPICCVEFGGNTVAECCFKEIEITLLDHAEDIRSYIAHAAWRQHIHRAKPKLGGHLEIWGPPYPRRVSLYNESGRNKTAEVDS